MYNINDKNTQSVAEAVKKVIENKKDFKPHMMYDPKTGKEYEAKTYEDHIKMKDMGYVHEKPDQKDEAEVQPADKDFVDLHTVDKKDDPEKERQVEEKEAIAENVTDFRGFKSKDKLVKYTSMAKKLKIKPVGNPIIMKRMGTDYHVQGFEGKVKDIEKAIKVAVEIEKGTIESANFTKEGNAFGKAVTDAKKAGKKKFKFQGKEYKVEGDEVNEIDIDPITGKLIGAGAPKKESVELDEKAPTMSQGMSRAVDQMYQLAGALAKGSRLNKSINKDLGGNYNSDFGKMEKAMKVVTSTFGDIIQDYKTFKEEVEIEEATKPEVFVKGGNAKITKREVDSLLSKIFINNKLAKAVESNPAYKDGYKGKVKKNPFKKDTIDFHLFILGQQSAEAE